MARAKKAAIDSDLVARFSDTVTRLLDERGLKQQDLAKAIGTSPDMMSKYLNKNGQNFPSPERIREIAQVLDVSVDVLCANYSRPVKVVDVSKLLTGLLTAVVELGGTINKDTCSISFKNSEGLQDILNTYYLMSQSAANANARLAAVKSTTQMCKDYVVVGSQLLSLYTFFSSTLSNQRTYKMLEYSNMGVNVTLPEYTDKDIRKALEGYAQFKTLVPKKIDELRYSGRLSADILEREFDVKSQTVKIMLQEENDKKKLQDETQIEYLQSQADENIFDPEQLDAEVAKAHFEGKTGLHLCLLALNTYFNEPEWRDTCIF